MIGKTDGLIDPIVMKAITDREVAAGRMLENDELRNLVAACTDVTTPEGRPKKSGGMLAGIKSWLVKHQATRTAAGNTSQRTTSQAP